MKFEVTYKCGHVGVIDIYGPMKTRQSQADHFGDQLCPKCLDAQRAKAAAEAAEKNASNGLPQLTGSPKQISWAEIIRSKIVNDSLAFLEKMPAPEQVHAEHPEIPLESLIEWKRKVERLYQDLIHHDKASWWIENKYYNFIAEAKKL